MNNETRIDRLTELKNIMINHDEYFPKQPLNMGHWRIDVDCGFAACALGSACYWPKFNALGLRMGHELVERHDNLLPKLHTRYYPKFNDVIGYEAGEAFFGITDEEVEDIFNPEQYEVEDVKDITPLMVAEVIDRVINYYLEQEDES